MENSRMELKMDEMEQVAAGSTTATETQGGAWGHFARAAYNITKAVYNKIVYSGVN